jgi:hypothetical protein
LSVAATPPSRSPDANAVTAPAAIDGSPLNDRPARASNVPHRATSATGARSVLTPQRRRSSPVALPSASMSAAGRVPITAAEALGGPGTRATMPPSWSVAITAGSGVGAASAAAWAARAFAVACASDDRLRW